MRWQRTSQEHQQALETERVVHAAERAALVAKGGALGEVELPSVDPSRANTLSWGPPSRPGSMSGVNLVLGHGGGTGGKGEVARLAAMVEQARGTEAGWYQERDEMRAALEEAQRRRAEAEAALAQAEGKYERMMREGVKKEVAERVAALEARGVELRDESEALRRERDGLAQEVQGLRQELEVEGAQRRQEQAEAAARLASLEEHVTKMHAASWSLQKTKLLQLDKLEVSHDKLRSRLLRRTIAHMRSRSLVPCWHAWRDFTTQAKAERTAAQAKAGSPPPSRAMSRLSRSFSITGNVLERSGSVLEGVSSGW